MEFVHRVALTITRKQPYADWANGPGQNGPDIVPYTDELPRTVYLVPLFDSTTDLEEVVADFWPDIFEAELAAWSEDETAWPAPLTRELFDAWFGVELTDTIVDLAPEEPLTEAEMEQAAVDHVLLHCAWCDLELEPDEGRRVGFEIADRERLESREGLAFPLVIDDEQVLSGIVTTPDSPAAAEGADLVFRACSSRCEKLIRKEAPRALRRLLESAV